MTLLPNKNSSRIGDWIQTYTGKCFWPLDPREDDVDIEDIAHSLSMICRFNGHCKKFYSVAEHSLHVSKLVPQEFALWGLLHDAAEAYVCDLPWPLKSSLPFYRDLEHNVLQSIGDKFNLEWPLEMDIPRVVKEADNAMLALEKEVLMQSCDRAWAQLPTPPPLELLFLSPAKAKASFLRRFYSLVEQP